MCVCVYTKHSETFHDNLTYQCMNNPSVIKTQQQLNADSFPACLCEGLVNDAYMKKKH